MAFDNQIVFHVSSDAVCHWFKMEIYGLIQLRVYRRAPDKVRRLDESLSPRLSDDKTESMKGEHKKSISILSNWSMNKELNAHKRDTSFM